MQSIGKPLPGRRNIVISRSLETAPKWFELYNSPEELLINLPPEPTWIIGGGEIYRAFIPYIDHLYVSYLDGKIPVGDPMENKDYVFFIFDTYIGCNTSFRFIPFGYNYYDETGIAKNPGNTVHIEKYKSFMVYHYIKNPQYTPKLNETHKEVGVGATDPPAAKTQPHKFFYNKNLYFD